MKNLLVIQSSGRITRSITRQLTNRFAENWKNQFPNGHVVHRDLTANPPPVVNEAWIAAAYGDPSAPAGALEPSDALIAEFEAADTIVIGAPVYNFGMPAQLKAYIDQIVRVGRTFAFDPTLDPPYQPLLRNRPLVIVTSAGDGGLFPGGPLAHMNHLEPHLVTAFGFIGLTDPTIIRAGYDEYQDDRTRRSLAKAGQEIDNFFPAPSTNPISPA